MEYIGFGSTGIRVSPVCLGTMTFGKEADETASLELMDRAFELGVNFFDTANIYNKGVTEQIVGRWLKSHRSAVVLASKAHFATGEGPNDRGSSRRHLLMEIDKILSRLQTDWLDILYLHHWDPRTPIEETLSALTALVDAGKVHYCGVSNFAAWQTMKAIAAARAGRWAPIACIQPMYNLVKRQAEVEILPMAASQHLAVCPYNPLAAGLLTGKYRRGETGRARADHGDSLAGVPLGRYGGDPPVAPRQVDDRHLDVLDRDRLAVDAHDTGGFARGRAEPSGELGKVVRGMQPVGRAAPVVTPHQVVPLGNQVAQRAALVAERNAAVHAAARLGGDDRQHRLAG